MIYGGLFEPENKRKRIKELENKMSDSNFWNDRKNSENVIKK